MPNVFNTGKDAKELIWTGVISYRPPGPAPYQDTVASLAISPNGKYFAVGGFTGQIYIYDIDSGLLLHKFPAYFSKHRAYVECLAFSPDSQFLASSVPELIEGPGTENLRFNALVKVYAKMPPTSKIVNVWRVSGGSLAASYPPSKLGGTGRLSWSPDGNYLAFAASDRTVRIWSPSHADDPGIIHCCPRQTEI